MIQAMQSSIQDNLVSNTGIEQPRTESRYSYVNSFFEKGCQKLNQSLDYVKSHKLATIGALAVGAMAFFIYAERDKHAHTIFSALAEPIERLSGHCMTDICQNTENLREALKTNDLVKILAVKGPFRSHPSEKVGDSGMGLIYDFNKKFGEVFFNAPSGEKNISVLDFAKHPYFHEIYLREFSSQPLGDLVMQEFDQLADYDDLVGLGAFSTPERFKVVAYAKKLKTVIDQIASEKSSLYPHTDSLSTGTSFLAFLRYLQDETGVQFNLYGRTVKELDAPVTPEESETYEKYLSIIPQQKRNVCLCLLSNFVKNITYFPQTSSWGCPDRWKKINKKDSEANTFAKVRMACERLQWRENRGMKPKR